MLLHPSSAKNGWKETKRARAPRFALSVRQPPPRLSSCPPAPHSAGPAARGCGGARHHRRPIQPQPREGIASSPNCAIPARRLLNRSCRNRDGGGDESLKCPGREENFRFILVGANLDLHWRPGHHVQRLIGSIFPEGRKSRGREASIFCLFVFGPKHHLFPVSNQPSSAFVANIPLPLYCRCRWALWHLG